MDTDLNHGTLTGTLERNPLTRIADHGPLQVSCTLRVDQPGPAGQRSTTIPAGRARRGRIIFLLADGMSLVQIAAMVGTTRRGVYTWAGRFLQYGLEGLTDKPGRGRRPLSRQQDRTSAIPGSLSYIENKRF